MLRQFACNMGFSIYEGGRRSQARNTSPGRSTCGSAMGQRERRLAWARRLRAAPVTSPSIPPVDQVTGRRVEVQQRRNDGFCGPGWWVDVDVVERERIIHG